MRSTLRRFLLLPLLIIFTVAATLPFEDTQAFRGESTRIRSRQQRSRAWWRKRRAVLRRRRLLAQRRRLLAKLHEQHAAGFYKTALRSRQISPQAAVTGGMAPATDTVAYWTMRHNMNVTLPALWASAGVASDLKFFARGANGQAIGTAVLAPVVFPRTPSNVETATRQMRRTIGGVPLVDLRRMVIDRMVAEGGWVINDVVREVNGQTVFVVLAQTDAASASTSRPSNGLPVGGKQSTPQQQSWAFYFVAVNNQAYSLVTAGPSEFAQALATDAEQVVASLRQLQKSDLVIFTSPHPMPAPAAAVSNNKVEALPPAASASNQPHRPEPQ